jgi:hypothetical protein
MLVLSSCKFSCKVGAIDEPTGNTQGPVKVGDGIVYNGIQLTSKNIKLNKAYLSFENGDKVPDNNIVDFASPIRLMIRIDSGWISKNDRVILGASEKVTNEDGKLMLDEKDLFAPYTEGASEEDAKILAITATVKRRKDAPPTIFNVSVRVWDKNSDAYIEAKYKLYSK